MSSDLNRGFFKIWYKIDQSKTWSRGLAYIGLMTAIMQKQELKHVSYYGGEEIPVGSFAVVISSWAAELGINRVTLSRMLKVLAEEDEFITLKNMNNRFCIVSVVKHDLYQSQIGCDEQPANNRRTTNVTTGDTTDEQSPIRDKENIYSDNFLEFSTAYQQHQAKTHGAKAPKLSGALYRRGAETVAKLIKLDGFTFEYIREVLLWAQKDDFWQDKVRSLSSLRKKAKGADETKFQNVAAAYDAQRTPTRSQPQVNTDVSTVYGRKLG